MTRGLLASRRRALQQLAALCGVLGLHVPLAALGCRDEPEALEQALAVLLPSRASAAAVGEAYLRQAPLEASAGTLEALILGSAREAGLPITAEGLRLRIERDFVEEKIVRLDGWVLSATEVRLCALTRLRTASEPAAGGSAVEGDAGRS